MKTAIDSSVLLDILLDDRVYAERSQRALTRVRSQGALIVSEVVVAELGPALSADELVQFLGDLGIEFVPSSIGSATIAGQMMSEYLNRGGKKGRIIPDFLIGAHASQHAGQLLARDRGYLRDYFSKLEVIDPE